MSKPVPVLYYHSVADHESPKVWDLLSCPIRTFERQMAWLARKGWYTCNWQELKDHLDGIKALPDRTVMLHFDDGFLDNWSVVHPIMEKHGHSYSILLTPDFIEPGEAVREQLSSTPDRLKDQWWGYLSKAEIKRMADSGLVDFQAHGHTHTWYPDSDSIADVYDGNQTLPHLMWNIFPESKPYWHERYPGGVMEGYPIFSYEKSLANARVFIPNEAFIGAAIRTYDASKTKAENLASLQTLATSYRVRDELGRYETTEERLVRLEKELAEAQKVIEGVTGKPVEYLVYPGGGHTPETDALAFQYGYKLLSKGTEPNAFGSKLKHVQRFTGFYPFKPKAIAGPLNMLLLRFQLARGQGNRFIHGCIQLAKRFM